MTKKDYIAHRIKVNVIYVVLLVLAILIASTFLGPPTDYATPVVIIIIGIAFMEYWGYRNWQRQFKRQQRKQ